MAKAPAKKRTSVAADGAAFDYTNLGSMGEADIMALALIVMMEAAKSAREDLKAIMDGVRAINKAKDAARRKVGDCKDFPCLRARIQAAENAAENLLDAVDALGLDRFPKRLSDMSQMDSLRLQMAMDGLSKTMGMLSNLMKKQSETAASIAKNIK